MIAVQSLTKRYGGTVAVDGLSFSVRSGSILGFLGPNGAGKTTTLRVLLGLAEPTSGSATIDGVPYRSLPDPLGSVGAVLDSSGFHPGRRGRNHLRVIARGAGLPVGRVDEVLRLVELGCVAPRRGSWPSCCARRGRRSRRQSRNGWGSATPAPSRWATSPR